MMIDFLALIAADDLEGIVPSRRWDAAVAALARSPAQAVRCHTASNVRIAHVGGDARVRREGSVTRFAAGYAGEAACPDAVTSQGGDQRSQPPLVAFDAETGCMTVTTDRFGACPVYLLQAANVVVVSTRLASVAQFAAARRLDRAALREVLLQRSGITEHALLEGVVRLPPAHVHTLSLEGVNAAARYWRMQHAPGDETSFATMARTLRSALDDAISSGAPRHSTPAVLLSGGVDSSVVAAIAREHFAGVRCYVAALEGDGQDVERARARFVASQLGLPLAEVPFDPSRLPRDLRRITDLIEAPPRNPNNLVLAQLYTAIAEDGLDTALNGDGAEMMIGLGDTEAVQQFGRKHEIASAVLPRAIRLPLARWLRARGGSVGWRLGRLLDEDATDWALGIDDIEYLPPLRYEAWAHVKREPTPYAHPCLSLFGASADFDDALHTFAVETTLRCTLARHQALAPGFGVRAYTPFVHPAIVEFSHRLPRAMRRTERSRPVLKILCDDLVHEDVARWPKLGFPVPWKHWLRTCLRDELGTADDYRMLEPVLPQGFVAQAFRAGDGEALWTLMTLRLVMDALRLRV